MKEVAELFADLTMLLEDLHGVAVEGQRSDLSTDMQEVLLTDIRKGARKLSRIMLDIALAIPCSPDRGGSTSPTGRSGQ